MTEEELTKEAWELINNVSEKIDYPPYVSVSKKDDGSISFLIGLSSDASGSAFLHYKPSIKIVKNILKLEKTVEDVTGKKLAKEFSVAAAECYAYGLLKNFPFEFNETFKGFSQLGWILLTQAGASAINKSSNRNSESAENRDEKADRALNEYLLERNKKTKERLLEDVKKHENSEKPVKHLIEHFYSNFLPDWKEAKNCYKKNKSYGNWEQMVSLAFPQLPKDLISCLDDSDPYISMPSALALEHSARACGIEDNSVGLRTLQQYLRESRQWIAENGEEAKKGELDKYFWRISEDVISMCRVFDSLGKEPNFDNLSYFHQVVGEDIKDIAMEVIKKHSENA